MRTPILCLLALTLAGCVGGQDASRPLNDLNSSSISLAHQLTKRRSPPSAFDVTAFTDLALQGRSMRNARVRVPALLTLTGGQASLRDAGGKAAVPVDVSHLEPDEKAWLQANCTSSCQTEILGIVQVPPGSGRFYVEAYYLGSRPAQPG